MLVFFQAAVELLTDVQPASVHILLQIPQYAVLTAGEVMFSITGLEFAYSQVSEVHTTE